MNKKAKILVVDDEDNIRESLKEILADEGMIFFLPKTQKLQGKLKTMKSLI